LELPPGEGIDNGEYTPYTAFNVMHYKEGSKMPEAGGNETYYVSYLRNCVDRLIAGQGRFTIQELATFSQLKVTNSMRRRLRQWVDLNDLTCWYKLGENGRGSMLVYSLPRTYDPKSGEIPF
jgi:hypothetical protein